MKVFGKLFLVLILALTLGCSAVPNGGTGGDGDGDGGGNNVGGGGGQVAADQVNFNPVGAAFPSSDLIDLEFLPGQSGQSIVIGLGGTVYYVLSDFTPLAAIQTISVDSDLEQGLLSVAADPNYNSNHFVYFYRTAPGHSPDVNQVIRYTVNVNVNGGTFALEDCKPIIAFNKSESSNPGNNHNGGSMIFDFDGNLLLGVGDGGGIASTDKTEKIGQNLNVRLGKIHRIVPDTNPAAGTNCDDVNEEHFTVPTIQQVGNADNVSTTQPSIYAPGMRNPFTIVLDEEGDVFFGDVGSGGAGASGDGAFEEINCLYFAGENYGWPLYEGPSTPFPFRPPTHGYRHGDDTFADEDPSANSMGGSALMVNTFYLGDAYGGKFDGMLIYSEFYQGWVRVLDTNSSDFVISDEHLGHLEGLVNLQKSPVDGFLYGVSLGGSDHVLKMELVP